ncbi:protein phosphatase PP2A regulatory subunit A-like [Cornus florida]|uniref:protein phosphatase PP2A regulatory subunit A-like n=1 Tax=Cornus florida TaxID=4283 RepID=UPI002896C653|nr:protein phosphatase PP2A regulatory subunit A-like [Cornus florida]
MELVDEPVDQLAVLIHELKHDDIQLLRAVLFLEICWSPRIVLHIFFPSLSTLTRTDLVPAYVRLLRDNEAEVRIASAAIVTNFCWILNPELAIQHIIPCMKELSSDSSQQVRSALASFVMGVVPILGKNATSEHLLPIILSLLKDEFPVVRHKIISKFDQVIQGEKRYFMFKVGISCVILSMIVSIYLVDRICIILDTCPWIHCYHISSYCSAYCNILYMDDIFVSLLVNSLLLFLFIF